jgi:hypothetical protein
MTRITYAPSLIASWLDSGYRLVAGQFTYSVPGAGSTWPGYTFADEPYLPGYATVDAGIADGFVSALAAWDELITPDFVRVADDAAGHGELRIAITDIEDDLVAYAYFPTSAGGKPGDIWLNAAHLDEDWDKGSYGYLTLLHEIGHSLGIDHSFVVDTAPAALDSLRYTVMSYSWIEERYVSFGIENGQFFANFSQPVAETPMVLDVATIQQMYGTDPDTRPNDTIYSFTAMSPTLRTIYDAGGTDTFDLSAVPYANVVDLQPGAYSSIGKASVAEQIAYWSTKFPEFSSFVQEIFTKYLPERDRTAYTFTNNVGIALSTTIENAIGGSGNDEISGNGAANVLIGNAGNDLLVGLGGKDRLEGGAGDDQLYGNGILVMPAGLAIKPGEPVAPPPVVPTPVTPAPVTPAPVGDGSDGGIRFKLGTAAAMQSLPHDSSVPDGNCSCGCCAAMMPLPHKIALAFVDAQDEERGSLRLTVNLGETPAPAPAPNPLPEPVAPPLASKDDDFDDLLFGGEGNDLLVGGAGRDWLSGGPGADTFRFANGDFAGGTLALADVISDFNELEGDRIDLSAIDAIAGGADDAFRFLGSAAFSGAGGELRTGIYSGYLVLEGDTTADGKADFAIRLDGLATLSIGAIIV